MTHLTPLTFQQSSRLGAAILLVAATTGRCGFAQRLPSRPSRMLVSLSSTPGHPHPALATVARHGHPHPALAASTKATGTAQTPAAPGKSRTGSHPLASASRPAVAAHAPSADAVHPGAARELLTISTWVNPRLAAEAEGRAPASPLVAPASPLVAAATPRTPAHALVAAAAAGDPRSAAFSFTGTADAEHAMHLTVGHLMFLNTKERVRRIYIANPAVLDSYTVSPNQIVVTAKAPGLSSVVVWDQTDQFQVYTVSSDVNVDELRVSLKQALPNDSVQVEGREAKVVLSGTVGTDASSDTAAKLAGLFSKEVANSLIVNSSRVKQVRLKVRIVEVDRSKLSQFGVNIFGPGGTSQVGGGTTSQFPSTATYTAANGTTPATISVSDPLNFFLYSFNHSIGVTIKDLENKQVLQILAEPTITTLSGQKASFLAGGEFPFPVVQGSAGGTATVTVQFRPYGVKLEFTPVVNNDGSVSLKVAPEVSALDFTNSVTISGYTIPALATKRADTQVVLQDGQSFAISGLLDRRTTDAFSHTPGIASVPILGQIFRSKNVNLSTSELMVIVTPTVVDPLSERLEAAEPFTPAPSPKDNPGLSPVGPPTPTRADPAAAMPFMKPDAFDQSLRTTKKKK